ncbi:hypothetical protein SARC_14474, partial [Sphaeroforma arctica JP610]
MFLRRKVTSIHKSWQNVRRTHSDDDGKDPELTHLDTNRDVQSSFTLNPFK